MLSASGTIFTRSPVSSTRTWVNVSVSLPSAAESRCHTSTPGKPEPAVAMQRQSGDTVTKVRGPLQAVGTGVLKSTTSFTAHRLPSGDNGAAPLPEAAVLQSSDTNLRVVTVSPTATRAVDSTVVKGDRTEDCASFPTACSNAQHKSRTRNVVGSVATHIHCAHDVISHQHTRGRDKGNNGSTLDRENTEESLETDANVLISLEDAETKAQDQPAEVVCNHDRGSQCAGSELRAEAKLQEII